MKITTKISIKTLFIYINSLNKRSDKEAYIDMLKNLVVLKGQKSIKNIEVESDTIDSLNDKTLTEIGMKLIEENRLSEYYNSLNHEKNFFNDFKMAYMLLLNKQFEQSKIFIENHKSDMEFMLNSLQQSVSIAVEEFKPYIKPIKEFLLNITEVAKSINWKLASRNIKKITRFPNITLELNWFPAAVGNLMTFANINEIVDTYDSQGKEKTQIILDDLFIRLYNADEIDGLYSSWKKNKELQARLPILKEAVTSHLEKNFYASVCTILPQIEGILRDTISSNSRRINGTVLEEIINKIVSNDNVDEVTKKFYFEIILENFWHGDEIPVLSRHAILHGEDTTFGTEVNSLKLILLFDFLQEQIAKHKTS